MNATDATCPKSVRHEAVEVMRCVWESLREPEFAIALVFLVAGEGLGAKPELAGCSQFGASVRYREK